MSERVLASFLDGPLGARSLTPPVAAIMLRVAVDAAGAGRCVLLGDDPRDDEVVYVYMMCGAPSHGFWDGRDERGRRTGGKMILAAYGLLHPQPAAEILRSSDRWKSWCEENKATLLDEYRRSKTADTQK